MHLSANRVVYLSFVSSSLFHRQVVMALLWMGADPYVLDSYGNTPKTTAEAFDHLKIAVGLQAVSKKETELAQALNVYDEVERGVERAEAFRVAVNSAKAHLFTL